MLAPAQAPAPERRRRRFSFGKALLWILLLLLIVALVALGLTGAVPGLSRALGATTPRDLGARPTPAQFAAVVDRVGYRVSNPPELTWGAGGQPPATDTGLRVENYRRTYTGQMPVDQTFSETELAALLTYNHAPWWKLKDVQVKVHADGTLETSALVLTRNIDFSQAPATLVRQLPKVMADEVPVYLKWRVDVVGPTQVRASVDRAEMGRVPAPAAVLSPENQQAFTDFLNDFVRSVPGFTIQSVDYKEGQLHFKGTFPKEFKRVPAGP